MDVICSIGRVTNHFQRHSRYLKLLPIGRAALLEIIIMTSQLGSPTTFEEFLITMALIRINVNGNIILILFLKKILYRYY